MSHVTRLMYVDALLATSDQRRRQGAVVDNLNDVLAICSYRHINGCPVYLHTASRCLTVLITKHTHTHIYMQILAHVKTQTDTTAAH